jgi:hypothetical protein
MLRFELSWSQVQVVYLQSSTGGRELLQELTLGPSDTPLEFGIPFGTTRAEILALLGPPRESSAKTLGYICDNMLGGDRLTFSFREDRLDEIHWWIFID